MTAEITTEETTFSSCKDGTALTIIKAIGAGHDLDADAFGVPDVTWGFLAAHRRSGGS